MDFDKDWEENRYKGDAPYVYVNRISNTYSLDVQKLDGGEGKVKAIPLQAWTGPEGFRRLRFPDFKTVGT